MSAAAHVKKSKDYNVQHTHTHTYTDGTSSVAITALIEFGNDQDAGTPFERITRTPTSKLF